jgi:RNA polymerase sigma-70 factor (ECF subfamily)
MRSTSSLIGTLFRDGSAAGMTDEQLLERFLAQPDSVAECAFTAIVHRHGAMVLRVCQDLLRNADDAEDAFQATFLVLARRASTLQHRARLAPWLYGVARRTAAKTRTQRARGDRIRGPSAALSEVVAASDKAPNIIRREEADVLHEEISRLPERYRSPVMLCYLEGLTHEEAARQLGWPIGTVGVRLMRARERLRERLTRRGVAPAGIMALPLLNVDASIATRTARAALAFCARTASAPVDIPSHVKAIAGEVLSRIAVRRCLAILAALSAFTAVAAGSVALAFQSPPSKPQTNLAQAAKSKPKAAASNSILLNGGIELADANVSTPRAWNPGATVPGVVYEFDRTTAHQGRGSLHLKKTVSRFFPIAQWMQEVKHTSSAPRLKVGAFIKVDKAAKAVLDVAFSAQDNSMTHEWVAYVGPQDAGSPPVSHDWRWYERIVTIPAGTQTLLITAQIYGPGDVWFDDIIAEYTESPATETAYAQSAGTPGGAAQSAAPADVADVPAEDRKAGDDPRKRYFLIGPNSGSPAPADGYRLLVVLPGGDGGTDFQPFVRRISKNALPPGYLIAELVAYSWTPTQAEQVVWPTASDKFPGAKFTTEEFVNSVVADVAKVRKVDPRYVFALGWSSGGPPVYAASLRAGSPLTGAFIAMSVFRANEYRSLKNARNRGYYILHSPEDAIPIAMAETARKELRQAGGKTQLHTYEGGHGWHGDLYAEIRRGIEWLEANHANPPKK